MTVRLLDPGLGLGAIENWEASLYAGAIIGEEAAGRFTGWLTVDNRKVSPSGTVPHCV